MNYSFEFIMPCIKIKGQPKIWKCKGCSNEITDINHGRGKKREFCEPNCRSKYYRRIKKSFKPDLVTKRIVAVIPS